ncbi:response regulator [Massilia antarctica]|uniref:Response regulator n=1 Tax=Massilia antarctica TaxID=2765360 RepID=A0AA48W9I5_9BURK|nr:HD domain-containing phosphohydrolase [Massilia antarctica]QPI48338.1 response regulator [Massilia antarctica]
MSNSVILIVDDEPSNLALMSTILGSSYHLVFGRSGAEALAAAVKHRPAMVLLDIGLPDTDGYQLCTQIKALDPGHSVQIIFITAYRDLEHEAKGFDAGCVDYIVKPVTPAIVRARVAAHLSMVRASALAASYRDAILMLGHAGHYNDSDTGAHIWRMAAYARALAHAHGWDEDRCDQLEMAAPMHDTGKLGIPHSVLRKPGVLNAEEWQIMRTHPEIGHAILSKSDAPVFRLAAEISLRHHEKWDGSGYPGGLQGQAIPESARIVALADVFDALSMERPYKAPWPLDAITAHVRGNADQHFDPELVDVFFNILPELLAVREKWAERTS